MSFPRAAIKRFNDVNDNGVPPLGAYDPKFETDVAVSSAHRSSSADKWGRSSSTGYSHASISSGAPLGATGRVPTRARSVSGSRANNEVNTSTSRRATSRVSFTGAVNRYNSQSQISTTQKHSSARDRSNPNLSKGRYSTTGVMTMPQAPESGANMISAQQMTRRKSNTRLPTRTYSRSRVARDRNSFTYSPRRVPSSSTFSRKSSSRPRVAFGVVEKEKVDQPPSWTAHDSEEEEDNEMSDLEPGEVRPPIVKTVTESLPSADASQSVTSTAGVNGLPSQGPPKLVPTTTTNIFDEIQQLAENLQCELSEYKVKLGKERIRGQELEAKKLELEFINQTLKRQIEKLEQQKEKWELGIVSSKTRDEELEREKREMEGKLEELERKLEGQEEMEFGLRERLVQLEQEKSQWEEIKWRLETTQEQLRESLKEETDKKVELEGRIEELEGKMDSYYTTCANRMQEMETMKETYEVKILELQDTAKDSEEKQGELRRQMETQKMVMEIMKNELEEMKKKGNSGSRTNNNLEEEYRQLGNSHAIVDDSIQIQDQRQDQMDNYIS